jgi:hypothetical protein
MQVGTYADGRALSYDEAGNQFDIGGSPVTPEQVRQYDHHGQLSWLSDEYRHWAHQVAIHAAGSAAPVAVTATVIPTHQSVPRCLSCGAIAPWKVDGILRPMDWAIGLLFLIVWGGGLVYLIVVALIRSNPNNRAKICTRCGARNMFTFQY